MLNMDFNEAVAINTADIDWETTNSVGVWVKKLESDFAKAGHATSLFRYEPGSVSPTHENNSDEEILVLEGTLIDENGEHPAGTYLRYPNGSAHSPSCVSGCLALVKSNQFDEDDNGRLIVNSNSTDWLPGDGLTEVMPLYDFGNEFTALQKWPAGTKLGPHRHFGGEEMYVVSGCLCDEYGQFSAGSWLRYPHNSEHFPYVEVDTVFWIKTGHLLLPRQ